MQKPKEKQWFQATAIFFASLSSMTFAMLFAWPSPSIPKIITDTHYNITLAEASYFTVLPPIGSIVSCLLFSKLTDVIGRKYTLLSVAIPYIASWALISSSSSIYLLYLSRFIEGFGDAGVYTSLPIYVGEVATPQVRGTWGNLMTFFIYFGQVVINVLGSYLSVQLTAKICVVVPVIFAGGFFLMPETPYFYLMKGRLGDARSSLQRLRRREDVEEELGKLKGDVERQMSESGSWRDLFMIDSNRRALYAGVFLRASQQLSGVSAFSVYTQYIFSKSNSSVSGSTSAIIFMLLCTVLNVCAAFVLDKIGRTRAYFWSVLVCGFLLLGEAVFFFIDQFYKDAVSLEQLNWLPLAGMILFVLFYSFGLGIVPTLMLGELFSTSIKGKGLCVLNIVFAVLMSVSTKLFHVLDSELGLFAPFLFFSVCCFVCTVLSLYLVPETKGKTLEEIQQSLKSTQQKIQEAKC